MQHPTRLALGLVVAAACGGKKASPPPPAPGTAGSGSSSGPTAVAPSIDAALPPPRSAVKLALGEVTFGCIGWSETTKAVACVTGIATNETTDAALRFVGSTADPVVVGSSVETATQEAAAVVLGKDAYAPLPGAPTPLVAGAATAVGGVAVTWAHRQTDPGGHNVAPTIAHVITARCGDQDVELVRHEAEGHDGTPTYRAIGDRVVVELRLAVGREGEFGHAHEVAVLDRATCAVARP